MLKVVLGTLGVFSNGNLDSEEIWSQALYFQTVKNKRCHSTGAIRISGRGIPDLGLSLVFFSFETL